MAEAERRQLTILFIDLVGSTSLAARLDPEELRFVVQEYQRVCSQAVESRGGHVAQLLGDGMLCYFGYPSASEHDPDNALRAALDAVSAVSALTPLVADGAVVLQSRAGVHTGPVVVGEMISGNRRETLAVGQSANLAARLQAMAEPDQIVVSGFTQHLVGNQFEFESIGETTLRGIGEPTHVFRLLGAAEPRDRLDRSAHKLTPFTGRGPDLAILLDRWHRVEQGDRQIVLINGEAGIGKSRLVRAVRERVASADPVWLECRGAPHDRATALSPLLHLAERSMGFGEFEDPAERVDALRRALERSGIHDAESTTLMAALLNLPSEGLAEVESMSPAEWRRASLAVMADWMLGLAAKAPLVLVLEDLHWMDRSTLDWINVLMARRADQRILVIATQRPQAIPTWAQSPDALCLNLGALTAYESEMIVAHIASRAGVEISRLQHVVDHTDGNPLYIEELANALLTTRPLPAADPASGETAAPVPESLQDSLMARLDAAGSAKELAQIASCLGREFHFDVLEAIADTPLEQLRNWIEALLESGLIYRRGEQRETYLFKHALIRDCAYQSLLKKRRQSLHREIAGTLQERFASIAEVQPELLAHHFAAANAPLEAVEQYCRAGERETARFAHRVAIEQYTRAIDLLSSLEESKELHARELSIRMSMGSLLSSVEGYGAIDVRANTARVRQLCDKVGESPQVYMALFQQWSVCMGQEDTTQLEAISVELLDLSRKSGDRGIQVETELAMAMTRHLQARVLECVEHARNASELYDPELDKNHVEIFGLDPGVMSLAIGGTNLVTAGYLDQAIEWHERAEALSKQIDHPYTNATRMAWFASALNHRRDYARALEVAQRSFVLAQEGGFKLMATGARGYMAGALVGLGRIDEAIAHATESSRGFEECNSRLSSINPVLQLAKAHLAKGNVEEGLEATRRCRGLLADGVDPFQWCETLRVESELLLARAPEEVEPVEKRLHSALEHARTQGARYAGLAAAHSFSRLLSATGRRTQARELLTDHLGWFEEGMDTALLREARASLADA